MCTLVNRGVFYFYTNTFFSMFPVFDLSTISNKETPVLRKIMGSKYLRQKFVNKYCDVFRQYLEWKTQALHMAKTQMPMKAD